LEKTKDSLTLFRKWLRRNGLQAKIFFGEMRVFGGRCDVFAQVVARQWVRLPRILCVARKLARFHKKTNECRGFIGRGCASHAKKRSPPPHRSGALARRTGGKSKPE
jgi:hypothetical protein